MTDTTNIPNGAIDAAHIPNAELHARGLRFCPGCQATRRRRQSVGAVRATEIINSVPELEALPQRSVILDRELVAWQKTMRGTWRFSSSEATSLDLMQALNNFQPVNLIYRGPE